MLIPFFGPQLQDVHKNLNLHDRDTIMSHLESELLCFGMSHQIVHNLQHVQLYESFKIWYFLNHV